MCPAVYCLPIHGPSSLLPWSRQCPQDSGVRFSGPGPKRAGWIWSLKGSRSHSFHAPASNPCLSSPSLECLPPAPAPQYRAGWVPAPTSVGRISPELQASHSRVLLHLIPRKFLLPCFMPHWLCHPRPGRLLGVCCPRIRGSSGASQTPRLTLLGFWPSGLLSLELTGHTGGPGPQQNMEDSCCLWAKERGLPLIPGAEQVQT